MTKKKQVSVVEEFTYPLARVRGMAVALKALAQVPLAAKLGYAIAQCIREFEVHEKLCMEQIKSLGRKYDATFADAKMAVPKINEAAFNVEVGELLETEVTVAVRSIVLPPECQLPAAVLVDLDDFVSVAGVEQAEPREPNPPGPSGVVPTDGEAAQAAVKD